jgi:hypothetical protein
MRQRHRREMPLALTDVVFTQPLTQAVLTRVVTRSFIDLF